MLQDLPYAILHSRRTNADAIVAWCVLLLVCHIFAIHQHAMALDSWVPYSELNESVCCKFRDESSLTAILLFKYTGKYISPYIAAVMHTGW